MAHPLDIHDIYLDGVPFANDLERNGCQITTAQKILDEHADKPVPERVAEVLRHYRLKTLDGAAIEVVRRSSALSADATTTHMMQAEITRLQQEIVAQRRLTAEKETQRKVNEDAMIRYQQEINMLRAERDAAQQQAEFHIKEAQRTHALAQERCDAAHRKVVATETAIDQLKTHLAPAGTRDYYGGATNPYEAIKVIEAWGLNFRLGSVLKYIKRDRKFFSPLDRLTDLEKAAWYLQREIQVLRDRLLPSEQTPDARAGLARQAAAPAKPSSAAAPSDWPTHDAALGSAYNAGDGTR